jgi:hypothetical protein
MSVSIAVAIFQPCPSPIFHTWIAWTNSPTTHPSHFAGIECTYRTGAESADLCPLAAAAARTVESFRLLAPLVSHSEEIQWNA